ncbi:hypothetical protein [Psychromonas sp. KJ10-2]|uniref:hypothetical protein n=1 Tax=Psychromonas sp. KJ10-2 TaxID=3391822 RepID=UPI0039B6D1C7
MKKDGNYESLDKLDKTILLQLVNIALEDDYLIDDYDESLLKEPSSSNHLQKY